MRNYSGPTRVPVNYISPVLFRIFGNVGLRRVACHHCVLSLVRSRRGRLLVIFRLVSVCGDDSRHFSFQLSRSIFCGERVERLARRHVPWHLMQCHLEAAGVTPLSHDAWQDVLVCMSRVLYCFRQSFSWAPHS